MKNNLFNRYTPRYFHELGVGDTVWCVNYGNHPAIVRFVIKEVRKNDKFMMLDVIKINETEESYRFSNFNHMYSEWLDFKLDKPTCCVKSYYSLHHSHYRFFSDETVAKHSLANYIPRLQKKLSAKKKEIDRNIEYINDFEKFLDTKMVKKESTCKCLKTLEIANANHGKNAQEMLTFRTFREYQVDVHSTVEDNKYVVYQNGGWDDYVRLTEEEFNKYFVLIK